MLNFIPTEHYNGPIENIVGDIKFFAHESDEDSLKDQFNKRYSFGGGWSPMEGFTMDKNKSITYPEDPPLYPLAIAKFRNQEVIIYNHSWVVILEQDGTFEASRMD